MENILKHKISAIATLVVGYARRLQSAALRPRPHAPPEKLLRNEPPLDRGVRHATVRWTWHSAQKAPIRPGLAFPDVQERRGTELATGITTGRNNMPSFQSTLQAILVLIAYMRQTGQSNVIGRSY
jgi:hypothetical protein